MSKKKKSAETPMSGYIPAIPAEAIQTEFFESTKNKFQATQIYPNRKYLTRVNQTTGASATIYTVPIGYNFVLLGAYIGFTATNATGSTQYDLYASKAQPEYIVTIARDNPAIGVIQDQFVPLSFGEGILYPSGTAFIIINGGRWVMGGVQGYEIPSQPSPPTFN